jgi:hypothetical protein
VCPKGYAPFGIPARHCVLDPPKAPALDPGPAAAALGNKRAKGAALCTPALAEGQQDTRKSMRAQLGYGNTRLQETIRYTDYARELKAFIEAS